MDEESHMLVYPISIVVGFWINPQAAGGFFYCLNKNVKV